MCLEPWSARENQEAVIPLDTKLLFLQNKLQLAFLHQSGCSVFAEKITDTASDYAYLHQSVYVNIKLLSATTTRVQQGCNNDPESIIQMEII